MLKTIRFLLALTWTSQLVASPASDETQIWNSEKAYWEYVKANDLEKYRALWHDDFVGWPYVNTAPVRKNQITEWITNNTSKGRKLRSYAIEQLAIQVTGDIAIDHYRIRMDWGTGDTSDVSQTDAVRITHTWIRTGNNTWQIIGGMSAPVNADGK